MIQIGDKILSRDLFENQFICHLEKCEGNCCVFGDSGAPLEDEEVTLIESNLEHIKPYMRPEGVGVVNEKGGWVIDSDGDKVTPLVGREECAFVVYYEGIARCAIERAFEVGSVSFQKPVSCHLYPIRVSRLKNAIALNYHRWSICEPARQLGKQEGIPVFRFLMDAIVRVYGESFYEQLETVYRELENRSEENRNQNIK